jgi:hypothetical protein
VTKLSVVSVQTWARALLHFVVIMMYNMMIAV